MGAPPATVTTEGRQLVVVVVTVRTRFTLRAGAWRAMRRGFTLWAAFFTCAARGGSVTVTAPPPMIAPPHVQAHSFARAILTDMRNHPERPRRQPRFGRQPGRPCHLRVHDAPRPLWFKHVNRLCARRYPFWAMAARRCPELALRRTRTLTPPPPSSALWANGGVAKGRASEGERRQRPCQRA
jgi:hypothetical protein